MTIVAGASMRIPWMSFENTVRLVQNINAVVEIFKKDGSTTPEPLCDTS